MKLLQFLLTIVLFATVVDAQTKIPIRSMDELMPNSVFSDVPNDIRHSKPYLRQRWFLEQRAYPYDHIPADAYTKSLEQKDALRNSYGERTIPNFNWVSLGPTPGAYFGYGNISSRIVTGAYHPTNPNIIYIGPANGGVWKSTDAGSTWSPMSDNESSLSMGAIAIDPVNPDIIYAGTGEATYSGASYYGRGLLKSTDAGATWTNITTGLPFSTYFSRLKIRPNNNSQLLAALGNSGLYRSTNAGVSWTQIVSGRVDDVVFSPTGDTAFAVGSGISIRRSIDGGATFVTFGSTGLGSGTRTHFDLAQSNTSVMWAAVYSSGVNVFKSTNYGLNWTSVTMPSGFSGLAGQAWYDLYCLINPKNHDKVYIGTIDIFRTENGSTFTNITNGYSGGNVHVDQHFIFFHPNDENTIVSCNDGGIWRSTNNGNSFINLNQNLTLTQFYRIAASPFLPSRILGGTQDNGTQQTFSSLSWAAAYGGDGGEVCFNPLNSNFILGETQYNGVFRTTNGGSSWNSAQSGLDNGENAAWVGPIIHHPTISGTFYTARQRVYKSTNNGGSWTAISINVNGSSAVREMAQSKSNPNIMFATSGSQVFKSSDEGATWSNVTSGLPNRTITSVYVHPTDSNQVFLTFSGFSTAKVYKSTNGGASWMSIQGNLPDTPVNDILVFTDSGAAANTYFAATDIGVFVTDDNGVNWMEITDGLPNTVIMHLDYSPVNKMLRAGTHGRGVYEAFIDFTIPVELFAFNAVQISRKVLLNWSTATEINNSGFEVQRKLKNQEWEVLTSIPGYGTTTEQKNYSYEDDFEFLPYNGRVLYRLKQIDFDGTYEYSDQVYVDVTFIPSETNLSQNYPNPFNPNTTIKYSLNTEGNVRVSIFNTIGQEIQELVSSNQSPGTYEVTWNAEQYSSGIYFYLFELSGTDGGQIHKEMKKLVLIK
ncbi:MAG: T9SS type A sorting domain-containing protein [Ignavibacteriaceae bacterium]